jgi:hypothetical protein
MEKEVKGNCFYFVYSLLDILRSDSFFSWEDKRMGETFSYRQLVFGGLGLLPGPFVFDTLTD